MICFTLLHKDKNTGRDSMTVKVREGDDRIRKMKKRVSA